MTEAARPPLRKIALGDLETEIATTRRVLERVPEEHFDWKPHPKSMSLGGLATHIATIPFYGTAIMQGQEFDVAAPLPPNPVATTRDEILQRFEETVAAFRPLLEGADDLSLREPWTLRAGERVVFTQPRIGVLRGMVVSHLVHHRGQLSVYLRLLDVPVPSIYGPSADEPWS
jgi:uncharacterized damage-inducible protein DinB